MANTLPDSPFGSRFRASFRKAFGEDSNEAIRRRLKRKSASDITKWMSGRAFPPGEVLAMAARITEASIHYWITGEGEADLDPFRFLEQQQRQIVEKFVVGEKEFDEVLREIVNDGLTARATAMLANRHYLSAKQIDQLRAIVSLVEVGAEDVDGTSEVALSLPKGAKSVGETR